MLRVKKRRYSAAEKRTPQAVCTLCAQEIRAGETLWQRDGATVCADCFLPFAREELRPFEYIFGEESVP